MLLKILFRVLLNGRELKEGVDYTVDYNIGQLNIRNDAALVPGADLKNYL